jgi:hypothetical protein
MANHMKEVANMLGVELDERFRVVNRLGDLYSSDYYYFTKYNIMVDGTSCTAEASMLLALVSGFYTIQRLPWKPNYNERYYSIGPGGVLEPGKWMDDFIDRALYKLGNCYHTTQEAEANRDKWVAFYESDKQLEV